MDAVTLALVMIVRDEQDWLPDTLDAALDLGIDHWTVADTGSQDKTIQIVQQRLSHLPGQLLQIAWEGNAKARNAALSAARGTADLLLQLDADMTVGGTLPDPAGADSWLVTIKDPPLEYVLPLLVRGDAPWYYKGVAHSYLHRDDRAWTEERCDLWVDDRRPGGWRPDKIEQDALLLEAELERNPLDARSSFYLAQTYENLGRDADALREYGRRVLLGGYDQERFVAKLRRARLLGKRDTHQGIAACLDAWQERPTRAEPLYVAARLARLAGWHDVALLFARQAAQIPQPEDRLFVEQATYAWGIPLELGLAEHHAGDRDAGELLLRNVRERDDVHDDYRTWIAEILDQKAVAA